MLLTLNLTAPPTLESVIFLNQTDLSKSIGRNHQFQNLSIEERKAISGPKNNQDIVIKPADKGSSVVVLNTTDYIKEATSQLSNNTFYNKLDSDPTLKHNMEVKKILDEMLARNEIDITCYNYLYNEKPRTPRFYLLPKIHKGKIPPPGRPIVSANNSPTERISAFVDYFLQPTIPKQQSYVKDTTHLLQKLRNIKNIPPGTLLVSLDVSSLYTNIPNKEAIRSIAKTLAKYRKKALHPTNQSIIQLLELVLTRNNFEYNGEHFIQVAGTSGY